MTTSPRNAWRTLPAGRELDECVAIQMGWHLEINDYGGRAWVDGQGYVRVLPDWSTDANAALTLSDGRHTKLDLEQLVLDPARGWRAMLQIGDHKRYIEEADTLALAICRAWLAWREGQASNAQRP